jgi:sugar O-acyltransferase (sialic acid O-acetyltransferase NeuD family)
MKRVVVVGGGGHARPVVEALRTSAARLQPVACTDSDPLRWGQSVDGVPIVGDDEALRSLLAEGVTAACIGLGGHGDNGPRARLHAFVTGLGFELPAVVHGWTHVARTASLGQASVILAGAVVGAGARLGENVLVNSAVTVEHDCLIGDHVHLASGCTLGGGVEIGAQAHVGLGAAILQGRRVGAGAIVGAGAVVVHDVAAGETVIGCPARAMEVAAHGPR